MAARAGGGKGRDRQARRSLSGDSTASRYATSCKETAGQRRNAFAARHRAAIPPLGGDHRSPSGYALGPPVQERFQAFSAQQSPVGFRKL